MSRVLLFINNILLPGGTERSTINLANNLARNGFLVEIVSLYSDGGESFFQIDNKVTVRHYKINQNRSRIINLYNQVKTFVEVYKIIKQLKTRDIVIGTVHSINIMFGFMSFLGIRAKLVGCEHTAYDSATGITKVFRRLFYRYLNSVVILTKTDFIKYSNIGVKSIFVIPNEVSFEIEQSPMEKENILLAIGRFSAEKRFGLLLELVEEIFKRHENWTLLLIGDGPQKDDLKNIIESRDLNNNVLILSPQKDISKYYKKASIYLMSSNKEGLPMVLLEAKAFGMPIVAFDCPTGPKELIEENDGFLIPMGGNQQFIENVIRLIDDSQLRNEMGKNSQKNVERYTSENILVEWKKMFNLVQKM